METLCANKKRASYKRFWTSNLTLSLLALTSCIGRASHPLIQPITPKSHRFWNVSEPKVDSLLPAFRWKLRSKFIAPDVTYDFVIYHAIFNNGQLPNWLPGPVVYYVEGLQVPEFRVDKPLNPNKLYLWSIRIRNGATVSEWATYDYVMVAAVPGAVFGIEKSRPFLFTTPKK